MSEEPERQEILPTNDAEEPWAFCPDCGNPTGGRKFCPQCGRPLQKGARPPATPPSAPAPAMPAPGRPDIAFGAEFGLGLLGLLGVSWLYARRIPVGLGLLLGWWGLLALVGASVLIVFGDVCCLLWLPFHISIPLISAFMVSGELRQARRRRLMGL